MICKLELQKNISKQKLLKVGFKKYTNDRYVINKVVYNSLIYLRIEIDIENEEIIWDVIDKNTQSTYCPFWNNINGENDLVATEVIENFENYIKELQNTGILRRHIKHGKRKKRYKS